VADTAADAVAKDGLIRPPPRRVSAAALKAYARDRLTAAVAFPKGRLGPRQFQLAGLDVTAWFTSEKLADLCERTLVQRKGDESPPHRVTIYAMDAEADGWDPPAQWDEQAGFSSREFDRILAAADLRGFYHHDGPSWQLYDRAAALGVQTLPTGLGLPPWELGSPLRLFLHWAYAAASLRLTHAATLGLNGRGALIAGPSGSGKSATTLAGLRGGLDSVGDDYVLVEKGPRVIAHPIFSVLKQDREGLRRAGVPAAEVDAALPNWRGKIEFDAAAYAPKGLGEQMEIFALLLPELARVQRTALQRVTAQEAALTLAPSSVFQLPGDATEGFRFLAGLARQLPAFRVKLSEDPAEIADALGVFLGRAEAHAG
jgi:hypothetical protein